MQKLRSVNTKFWEDPYIEKLKPEEKLLFLYFLTNPLTNLLGVYEISIKRISYDTSLTEERILKALKAFNEAGKVYYKETYIILPSFLKNQNLNPNMKLGAERIYNDLPNWLKDSILANPSKGFESLRNGMLNMNRIEVEVEVEGKGTVVPQEDIEKVYAAYPAKCHSGRTTGKSDSDKKKIHSLLQRKPVDKVIEIIKWYISDSQKNDSYIKNFSTFLNNFPDESQITTVQQPLYKKLGDEIVRR